MATWCRARAAGTQRERPERGARSEVRTASFALAVLVGAGRALLERRPPGGLLGGLWAFPEREVRARSATVVERAALDMARALGTSPRGRPRRLAVYEHRFTHLHATYLPCVIVVEGPAGVGRAEESRGLAWVTLGEPTELALPVTQRRILDDVAKGLSR